MGLVRVCDTNIVFLVSDFTSIMLTFVIIFQSFNVFAIITQSALGLGFRF